MGTFASGERKTIERLCCYIKDDSMIATYVGVPKSEVVRIRAKARRAPSERIGPSLDGPPKASERPDNRSEEHTSELQSLMRISYAVFCLKKKKIYQNLYTHTNRNKTNTQRLLITEKKY